MSNEKWFENKNWLNRYAGLYTSSPMSKGILCRYLGLSKDAVIPLSISHGIDFDHESLPQDINNSEPLHWAYNERILKRAENIKPSVSISHPWLLLHELNGRPKSTNNGRKLMIGPPPSRCNDEALLRALNSQGVTVNAILLKSRGSEKLRDSYSFWKKAGIDTLSAGSRDDEHFLKLMEIFSNFEYVVAPVYSSAIALASSMGCKIILLKNYSHVSYSLRSLDLIRMCDSNLMKSYLRTIDNLNEYKIATEMSREILGQAFLKPKGEVMTTLRGKMDSVRMPLNIPSAGNNVVLRNILAQIALLSGRSSFLKYGLLNGIKYRVSGTHNALQCKKMNLIDALLNGLNESNLQVRPLRPDEFGVKAGEGGDF